MQGGTGKHRLYSKYVYVVYELTNRESRAQHNERAVVIGKRTSGWAKSSS